MVTTATADGAERPVTERPLVVVEVLSPTSATRDFVLKRRTAAAAGVPEYWVVDPDGGAIVRHTLVGDRYEEQVLAPGDEAAVDTLPFPFVLRAEAVGPR